MQITLGEIAQQLGGNLEGDPNRVIDHLTTLDAGTEGALAFINHVRFIPKLYLSEATAVLVATDFAAERAVKPALIRVQDPYKAFMQLLIEHYSNGQPPTGIAPGASVAAGAVLAPDVYIAQGAFVGEDAVLEQGVQLHEGVYVGPGVRIGAGTVVHARATIHRRCVLGRSCCVHSGAVIGSDGFGFIERKGRLVKVPQIGNVVIGDEVEIGANSTIDRATIGSTVIGSGTKIDNLVHLAHNIEVGENCILAGQVGIAGSVRMGNGVVLGGQVGITGHVELADGVQISAKSGLSKSVSLPGAKLRGYPARDLSRQLKLEALIGKLPELAEEIRRLKSHIEHLEKTLGHSRPPDA